MVHQIFLFVFYYIISPSVYLSAVKAPVSSFRIKSKQMDLFHYLMGLDPLDVAGKIQVELELINIFVFSLCSCFFVVFADALLLGLFLQCCFGYRWVNRHNTLLTPGKRENRRELSHEQRLKSTPRVNQNTPRVWKQSYSVFTWVSVSGSLAIISARMCSTPVDTSSTEDRPDSRAQSCKIVITPQRILNSHNLVYTLPSTPCFTHCPKSSVCGVSISAVAATSRPSALALRAFVSLLPFL